jgi:hypothetical protein
MRSDISNYKVDHEIVVTLCSFLFLRIILTNLLVNCIRTSLYCYPIVIKRLYYYTFGQLLLLHGFYSSKCGLFNWPFFAYCCTSANTTEHANTWRPAVFDHVIARNVQRLPKHLVAFIRTLLIITADYFWNKKAVAGANFLNYSKKL